MTVAAGLNSAGNNFGYLPSSVSGTVFDDTNDNGVLDTGESPTPGVVFDDLDNTGVYNNTSFTVHGQLAERAAITIRHVDDIVSRGRGPSLARSPMWA